MTFEEYVREKLEENGATLSDMLMDIVDANDEAFSFLAESLHEYNLEFDGIEDEIEE